MKCRKRRNDVKTGEESLPRDQRWGDPLTASVASGIKVARVRSWLEHGTWEPVASMPREKLKWKPHESLSTDAGHRGGLARSSDEVPVMGLERRGQITRSRRGVNPAMGRNRAARQGRKRPGDKSRMSREAPVRFREGLGVKLPRATRRNIYVRTRRAGERVMESVTRFLTGHLRLKVNASKSAVGRPKDRKFLGFRFTWGRSGKRSIAPKALSRFKERIRELTNRHGGASLDVVVEHLAGYLNGWGGYYGFCQTPSELEELDGWIRRRLRAWLWQQWRTWKNRTRMLCRFGVPRCRAAEAAAASRGPWAMATHPVVHEALNRKFIADLGVPQLRKMMRT